VTDGLRHRTPLQVRFRDTDAFGHVNNAVFFSYLELARIRYLLDVLQQDEPFDRLPLILARVELDFRSPILFGEDVEVEDHRLVGEAQSVLVTYDYAIARPMPVPDQWRRRISDHEGRPLETDTAVTAG
jgi:acyl-CoA thioester hydrolase